MARKGSFTRAAAKLGVSQSALSQTVRALEARIGLRLLDRTTRSVSPTQAGARLLDSVAPRIAEIREEIAALGVLRDKPPGQVRITADDHAAKSTLWPRVVRVLRAYPDWCPSYPGYHLFYPSRRQPSAAFGAALRFRS